ncbi:hypothetical protein GGF46_005188 [Coemansia sp. RSA 552]|nr:hypothetical protein GGF46_005188 [Coemansia sp. RSA 552]
METTRVAVPRRRILRDSPAKKPVTKTRRNDHVAPSSTAAGLGEFVDSPYQGKREIAQLMIVRAWRKMAHDAAQRREELIAMWREAFNFRRRVLMRQAMRKLHRAALARQQEPGRKYERAQIQLADMHHRQMVHQSVISQMSRLDELRKRLEFWRHEHDAKLTVRCWYSLRQLFVDRRVYALDNAAALVRQRSSANTLVRAFGAWRDRAHLAKVERDVQQQQQSRILVNCLRAWHTQAMGMAAYRHQLLVEPKPVEEQEGENQEYLLAAEAMMIKCRQIASIYRLVDAYASVKERERQAVEYHGQSLRTQALYQLFDASDTHAQQKTHADHFHKYMVLVSALQTWHSQYRQQRDSIMQTRALRVWVRKQDNTRRSAVFRVWHKIAMRACATAQLPDAAAIQHSRTQQQHSSAHHSTSPARQPPLPEPHLETHDAQTMTSFLGEPTKMCERSISIQTAPYSPGASVERLELRRRAETAEKEVERYRRILDKSQAPAAPSMAGHSARDDRLESLMQQWDRKQRARLLTRIIGHFRARAQMATLADAFYRFPKRAANRQRCAGALSRLREELKTRRQLVRAADMRHKAHCARQLFVALCTRSLGKDEMLARANKFYHETLILSVWDRLMAASSFRRTERSQRSLMNDQGALLAVAQDRSEFDLGADRVEMDGILEQVNMDEMATYFDAWREVVMGIRDVQDAIIEDLPPRLQRRAIAQPTVVHQFDWGILHDKHLLRNSLRAWRQRLAARRQETARADDVDVNEGGEEWRRMAVLRKPELQMQARVAENLKRRALHRLYVAMLGNIEEKNHSLKTLSRFAEVLGERARHALQMRQQATSLLLRPKIRHWWSRYYVQQSRIDNADVQANGTLLRICLLHWVAQIRSNRPPSEHHDHGLYMKAMAFRWEKQARMAFTSWMHRSSDPRIRARLAERAQRRDRLEAVAQEWSDRRIVKNAFQRLRSRAALRKLQHAMSMRLAAAWGDANAQRHALLTWRMRVSPPGSMFFSVVGSD